MPPVVALQATDTSPQPWGQPALVTGKSSLVRRPRSGGRSVSLLSIGANAPPLPQARAARGVALLYPLGVRPVGGTSTAGTGPPRKCTHRASRNHCIRDRRCWARSGARYRASTLRSPCHHHQPPPLTERRARPSRLSPRIARPATPTTMASRLKSPVSTVAMLGSQPEKVGRMVVVVISAPSVS